MTASFRLLGERRFLPLFATQFLGAFNDNLFKQAMVLFATYSIYSDAKKEAAFSAINGITRPRWNEDRRNDPRD